MPPWLPDPARRRGFGGRLALRAAAGTVLVATALAAGCAADRQASGPLQVKVIAFNDYHGHLEPPDLSAAPARLPAAERIRVGGAAYLAAHVARLRSSARHSVVVGAGDSIGASPLISALFFDEPAVETLNRIGLEFNAVGNHEFDKGADELRRLQAGGCRPDPNSCMGQHAGTPVPFEGAKFRWLSANVVDRASAGTLLAPYGVKSFDGVRMAFIGVTLRATPTIVMRSGVRGLDFLDEAETVNRLVPELKAQGIEAVVLLLHEGGTQAGARQDINGCAGGLQGSPVAGIVRRLDDAVDLVISGHTHAAYNCRLPNAAGRAIPVTSASAFGRVLTDIDLVLDRRTGEVLSAAATNRLVRHDDIQPDPAVQAVVAGYGQLASRAARRVVGAVAADVPNRRSDAACNMPAGELIADAMLSATAAEGSGGARLAFMNPGGVRSPGFLHRPATAGGGPGEVTYGDAFTVQPFGNNLVTMTLSARDIKDALEEQFAGCGRQPPGSTRLLLPSAGFHYTWDAGRACGARIRSAVLRDAAGPHILVDDSGALPDPDRRFRVTVNDYLAQGGDGFSTFLRGADRLVGPQDIEALTGFLSRFAPPAAPYAPGTNPQDGGGRRIRRTGAGNSCPSGRLAAG
ncbi:MULTISPECIES: bifunctional metallophosphatase/5'-nucleotidase [Ramlibacter]|uniref:bifunctional metallophosphatase/5'-nucleotidase n=1 Tax=Ramlibacter TaxID=174951 RepID=UPI001E5C5759|nr:MULTISPECIES: bifunctional metallophosphatase/5'-nucleotidase [Ramlibacter]